MQRSENWRAAAELSQINALKLPATVTKDGDDNAK